MKEKGPHISLPYRNIPPELPKVERKKETLQESEILLLLLVPQCLYGVKQRGLVGRIEPEEDSYES